MFWRKFRWWLSSFVVFIVIRELKQLRRRRRRQLQKTIGLMIKTTALHVHHDFKYIFWSPPLFTARLRRETSSFDVLWRTWTYDDEFSFPFLNLDKILKNTFPGKVAYIWHIERVQVDEIKFERTQIRFYKRRFHCRRRRRCLRSLLSSPSPSFSTIVSSCLWLKMGIYLKMLRLTFP